MNAELRKKYTAFVTSYSGNKICLGGMMKNKFGEKFFDEAVNDNILTEIGKNELGQREFIFTDFAIKFI